MSESIKASDLLWAYVAAEKLIEQAEKQINDSRCKQAELLCKIKENKALVNVLKSPGVLSNERMLLMIVDALQIRNQPLFDIELDALKDIDDE